MGHKAWMCSCGMYWIWDADSAMRHEKETGHKITEIELSDEENEIICPYCGGTIQLDVHNRCESLSPDMKTQCELQKGHTGDHKSLTENCAWCYPDSEDG